MTPPIADIISVRDNMPLFKNRLGAARELAGNLAFLKDQNPLILGIPNYGVPIAEVIAESLDAHLDILLIAKLCAPQRPEQVVGAVDEHGRISMIQSAARWHHLTAREMIDPAREAFAELQGRRARYRAVLPETEVRGRTVVIVDHGVDTGATMLAAIASVRDRGSQRVIVAAPAGCGKATWQLHETADGVVIPHTPSKFKGVERFYETFDPVTDREVESILQRWAASRPEHHPGVRTLVMRVVSEQERVVHCELDLPPGTTRGSGPYPAVLFAHGLESDGRNPRSMMISRRLAKRGIMGVRIDFTGHGRSDGTIEDATPQRMLTDLRTVFENVCILDEVDSARIGLTGSGTGAMLALELATAAAQIRAVAARGPLSGREIQACRDVRAPTILIHGQQDAIMANAVKLHGDAVPDPHQLLEIPDSNRWFNDPISLELMVDASVEWLAAHLAGEGAGGGGTLEQGSQVGADES